MIAAATVIPSSAERANGDDVKLAYSAGDTSRKDRHGSSVVAVTAPLVASTETH
jgi:hypothetical protein